MRACGKAYSKMSKGVKFMMSGGVVEYFQHGGFRLAFRQAGQGLGAPVLLIHGFASSSLINWVNTGWFAELTAASHHVIAIDNRGHGFSDKSHIIADYAPELMADDAAALLRHLNIPAAHIMGYSMGARAAAYLALRAPEYVHSLILGGLGIGLVKGAGDWQTVREALLAPSLAEVKSARGQMFRRFADNTKSDLKALAACIISSKKELTEAEIRRIAAPVLVAVGTKDDIAGAPEPLAALLPRGQVLPIPGRDHMLAVGDAVYKQGALRFLAAHPF